MTDLSHHPTAVAPTGETPATLKPWPLLPYACVFVAGAAGLALGDAMSSNASAVEDKLMLLLRFMAALKFLGVVAAASVTHWRFGHPIEVERAWAYVGTLALMGLAPGLIWSLGGIAPGAVLFHVGLLAFLVLAWKDDGARLPRRR